MRTLIFAKIAEIFLGLLNYERITQSLVRDVIIQLPNSSFVQQRSRYKVWNEHWKEEVKEFFLRFFAFVSWMKKIT